MLPTWLEATESQVQPLPGRQLCCLHSLDSTSSGLSFSRHPFHRASHFNHPHGLFVLDCFIFLLVLLTNAFSFNLVPLLVWGQGTGVQMQHSICIFFYSGSKGWVDSPRGVPVIGTCRKSITGVGFMVVFAGSSHALSPRLSLSLCQIQSPRTEEGATCICHNLCFPSIGARMQTSRTPVVRTPL